MSYLKGVFNLLEVAPYEEFIVETDIEKGVYVKPIPGMFDEAEQV